MMRDAITNASTHGARRLSRVLAIAFSALLTAAALAAASFSFDAEKAYADDGSSAYAYTVTLFAGDGTFSGGGSSEAIKVSGLKYNDAVTITLDNGNDENTAAVSINGQTYTVTPNDDRYYPKGIRLAGQNESTLALPQFGITQNLQFVVAYGLTKDRVGYTVEYIDADGNELAEAQHFYGNVGDKPVAASQYIEGYTPNAYNITGTLDADASKNVFQFVYRPTELNPAVVTRYVNRGVALGTGPAVAMQAAAEAEAAEGADAGAAAGETNEPVELIDLDDDETPLASGVQNGVAADSEGGMNGTTIAAIAALLGLAVVFVIVIALLRRKSSKSN